MLEFFATSRFSFGRYMATPGAYDVPPYGYTGTYDVPPYVPDYSGNELTPNPDTIGVPPIATRSLGCQQQKVSVPSENGEMREVTIVRC